MRKVFALLVVVSALALTACGGGGALPDACPDTGAVGITRCSTAEDFTARTMDGTEVSLSDFRGEPVLLNFWASWCGPCQIEMPLMEQMYQAHSGEMHPLAVAVLDDEEPARTYFRDHGFSYTFLYKDHDSIANQYLIRYVPQTIFVAPDGTIVGHIAGSPDWSSGDCQVLVEQFLHSGNRPLPPDALQACAR